MLLGLIMIAIGCAKDSGDPDRCQLTGKVTLDGRPLADADLQLLAGPKNMLIAVGSTGAEGEYQLQDVRPGKYKVVIRYPGMASLQKQMPSLQNEKAATPVHARPSTLSPLYSDPKRSHLSVELEKGKQSADFSLESKPAKGS